LRRDLISSYVIADAPTYHKGHAVMLALNALSLFCMYRSPRISNAVTGILIFWLSRENIKLDRLAAESPGALSTTGRPMTADIVEFKARGQAPERFRYIV